MCQFSLVRYADHIACQRVEMMLSLSLAELMNQITELHMNNFGKFFSQFKYSFRHKRLILLLEQLQSVLSSPAELGVEESQNESILVETSHKPIGSMNTSPSIDFFMLYIKSGAPHLVTNQITRSPSLNFGNLDKEWYYNIVRSACCYSSSIPSTASLNNSMENNLNMDSLLLTDSSSLKSKQCALMLSNLDYSNAITILAAKTFKLTILKDCLLLGAKRTQLTIQKLPAALKQAAATFNIEKDFIHPLWLASTNLLFDLLNDLCPKLPKPPLITLCNAAANGNAGDNDSQTKAANLIYECKLNELNQKYDFYMYISPITEAINAYLKCIHQYPSLSNQLEGK